MPCYLRTTPIQLSQLINLHFSSSAAWKRKGLTSDLCCKSSRNCPRHQHSPKLTSAPEPHSLLLSYLSCSLWVTESLTASSNSTPALLRLMEMLFPVLPLVPHLSSPLLSIFPKYFQHKTCYSFPIKILRTKAVSGKISALGLYGAIKKRQSLSFSNVLHAEQVGSPLWWMCIKV